jgi:hypothetical protein
MKYFVILIASLAPPSCFCGGGSIIPSLQTRAAFELDCPVESLSIEHLGQWGVKGVRGCGKKAVYVYINGQWLRNSGGQDAAIQAALIEKQRREEEEKEERRRQEEEDRRERKKCRREMRKAANDWP